MGCAIARPAGSCSSTFGATFPRAGSFAAEGHHLPIPSQSRSAQGALSALMLAGGDTVERFSLPGGASLLEEGETSNKLYFLRAGRLAAIRRRPEGAPRLLNIIWPGEGIGEISLLANIPHSASVLALRD